MEGVKHFLSYRLIFPDLNKKTGLIIKKSVELTETSFLTRNDIPETMGHKN